MNQSNKLIELVKDIALETGQENLPKELAEISEECNKLEESLNTASNMQEIEDIIDEKESDFRFQIDWTRYVFENVEQLLKAKTDEKLTKYRLSHLMDVKTKKEIHDSCQKYGQISPYTMDELLEEVRTPRLLELLAQNKLIWDKVLIQVGLTSLRQLLRQYNWRKRFRSLKLGFTVFLGLVGFGIITAVFTTPISEWYLVIIIIPIVLVLLQQYVVYPWLNKKTLEKKRQHLKTTIREFYIARFQAKLYSTLLMSPYLENFDIPKL